MITDQDRTFFTLKFGTETVDIFNAWVEDTIALTRTDREILAELMDMEVDRLLSFKAQLIAPDQPWYSDDDD